MARQKSNKRLQAFEMWQKSGGTLKLKDIAAQLEVGDTLIRKWKNLDQWEQKLKSNVTELKSNVTKKRGAPKGNKNALGHGAPAENENAVKHGLFRKFLPDDDETREIFDASENLSPIDILWTSIRIQWMNIVRAQKIMFVRNQDDETTTLVGRSDGDTTQSRRWQVQHAWDKQAAALNSQARAMSELRSMIKQYEEMLRQESPDEANEERRLKAEKLKAEIQALETKDW